MNLKLHVLLRTVVCLALVGLHDCKIAAAQGWTWANGAGNMFYATHAASVATDKWGNVYTTGWFEYAPVTFGTVTLANAGAKDIYLLKYDSSGNLLWARAFGGGADETTIKVVTDNNNNVYITGSFSSDTVIIGSDTAIRVVIQNAFAAKLDASGTVKWVRTGAGYSAAAGIAADTFGNIFETGAFYDTVLRFGAITVTNPHLGAIAMYIAKYDSMGNVLWAKSYNDSIYSINSVGIATDRVGNAVVAGTFNGAALALDTFHFASNASLSIFLAKFSPSGQLLWARAAGDSLLNQPNDIIIDANSNTFVTGYFTGNTLTLDTTVLHSRGGKNLFLVKYDTAGNILRAKGAYCADCQGTALTANKNGGIFLSGQFVYDTLYLDTLFIYSGTTSHLFLSRLDGDINAEWGIAFCDFPTDVVNSIAADSFGNIFVGGDYAGTEYFGTTTLSFTGTTYSNPFVYTAKYNYVLSPSSLFRAPKKMEILLYPNPAKQTIALCCANWNDVTVEIYNAVGVVLLRKHFSDSSNNQISINVSGFPAGMYEVKVQQSNAVQRVGFAIMP
jgi:Secretion system C-terminal sorting domain